MLLPHSPSQLLMGEIPDRSTFNAPDLSAALRPYLALTSAVRLGNLRAFRDAVLAHTAAFSKDRTLSLIRRLDANVIKSGLRKLATSYSRISFVDIAAKLQLGSPEDAEFLCAKVRSSLFLWRLCCCSSSNIVVVMVLYAMLFELLRCVQICLNPACPPFCFTRRPSVTVLLMRS